MLILVSGGAASGKSEYAEWEITQTSGPRIYIATMQIWDDESRRRVARHRAMRAGKGFETVECPTDLLHVQVPQDSVVLLECLSNLTANEYFGPEGAEGAAQRILAGVDRLCDRAAHVVIVTNELFGDGAEYAAETVGYLDTLAQLNRALAARADKVVEVVCGIPQIWKGERK